ncbi:signal recognition particle-docking protein FtsY [bacterium]|nr:signal recognition particle-docking protein FtsY [bacterium]
MRKFLSRVSTVLRGRSVIDDELLEELEEALIQADVAAPLAVKLVEELRDKAEREHITDPAGLEGLLKQRVKRMLAPWETSLNTGAIAPTTFLVLGVNGTGKTTTIAKIANWYQSHGNKVMVVAADTFRAAAIDQLRVWAERIGCDIVAQKPDSDPGAVAYDALQAAKARGTQLAIIDTAGRLHTKTNLMEELRKIGRVVERELGRPADERLLVMDATTGQNGLNQVKQFHEAIGVTGIVLTKMDSTAKGGVVLTIADQLGIPIKLIGVGEKVTDLKLFSAQEFAEDLF